MSPDEVGRHLDRLVRACNVVAGRQKGAVQKKKLPAELKVLALAPGNMSWENDVELISFKKFVLIR